MTVTRNSQTPASIDITPRLDNSPVVMVVKEFVEALYNNHVPITTPEGVDRLNAFLKARQPRLVRAIGEIMADDAAILATKKMPDDRSRMIGTKRSVVI